MTEVLYRAECYGVDSGIFYREFSIIRKTPKGCWIRIFGKDKFVLNDSIKRYAYNDKESALYGFERRKLSQIRILTAQLQHAEDCLALVEGRYEARGTFELLDAWEG